MMKVRRKEITPTPIRTDPISVAHADPVCNNNSDAETIIYTPPHPESLKKGQVPRSNSSLEQ